MKKKLVNVDNKTLLGVFIYTNNKDEMNPQTSKIPSTVNSYMQQSLATQFNHRKNPGVTFAAYTDFESDENGQYKYFIGEEVLTLKEQNMQKFSSIIIPNGNYQKFTTSSGEVPYVVISAWQNIWKMNETDFEGKRKYHTDFEIYDHRASDPKNTIIDIYVGVKNKN